MADLKFGVIGTGRFGKHYLRLLQGFQGVCLAAAASRSSGNVLDVLRNPEIDAVIIVSPAETHFDYIKQALQNGKHVLVEKPMVLSVSEAEKVRALVKTGGEIFMVAHQYLYNDYLRYLAEEIRGQVLGKLQRITLTHLYPGPIREDVGVFWDAAPHEFAILDFLLGPVAVKTARGEKKYTAGKPVEDDVAAEVELADGTKVQMTLSSNAEKKVRKRVFVGSKGSAVFDDSDNKNFLQISAGGKGTVLQIAAVEPLRNELAHFIDCVRKNQTPLTDIEHGLRVVRNLESVYQHLD